MKMSWRLGFSGAAVALAFACASADTSPSIILNQWNVTALSTKDASGRITRRQVSGFFVLRSDLGYTENVTIDGNHYEQLSTYTTTTIPCDAGTGDGGACPYAGTITLTVIGVEPVSYNYALAPSDGGGPDGGLGGTMTWTSGALPDGGEADAAGATIEEWAFTLDSNSVLSQ